MRTKIVLFGEMYSGLMKQKWNCLAIMTIVMLQAEEHHPNREALHKIDGIMRQGNDVDILKQLLKTSVRKLKLGRKLTRTPSMLPKSWQNGSRTTKSRYWSGHHKALTSIL
jgi:hypothetical protein